MSSRSLAQLRNYRWICFGLAIVCAYAFLFTMDVWTLAGVIVALHAAMWITMWNQIGTDLVAERHRLDRDAQRRELVKQPGGNVVELVTAVRRAEENQPP